MRRHGGSLRGVVLLAAFSNALGARFEKWLVQKSPSPLSVKKVHWDCGLNDFFVYEVDDHAWWANAEFDENPFGCKLWPGAVAAARCLDAHRERLQGKDLLELGCGNGLTSIYAARIGLRAVGTDISDDALRLASRAARDQGLLDGGRAVDFRRFDVLDAQSPLPKCDLLVCADVLYDVDLARGIAKRVAEAFSRDVEVIVTGDPDRLGRTAFLDEIRLLLQRPHLSFTAAKPIMLKDASWKAKRVEIMHLGAPEDS
ncbi:S-adenosyl-L-methionine-dependent methyltransferase [Pelagophyceae sp. CCMP2097]|nr:S-adenosyl-L-methionine-dependent methyltransferase [Pelagophyceae sp. CCMP2097]